MKFGINQTRITNEQGWRENNNNERNSYVAKEQQTNYVLRQQNQHRTDNGIINTAWNPPNDRNRSDQEPRFIHQQLEGRNPKKHNIIQPRFKQYSNISRQNQHPTGIDINIPPWNQPIGRKTTNQDTQIIHDFELKNSPTAFVQNEGRNPQKHIIEPRFRQQSNYIRQNEHLTGEGTNTSSRNQTVERKTTNGESSAIHDF